MALFALAVYVVGIALTFGVRSVVQRRRTGDAGFRLDAGSPGSPAWWGKLLLVAALVLGLAGPLVALAGVPAMPALDHGGVRLMGAVVGVVGVVAVLAAQARMGASWRVGVDPAERTALVTGGMFGLVRNPVFTAMLVASAGVVLMVPNLVAIAATLVLLVSVEVQVRAVEEPHLLGVHGESYARYAARVGRFVPLVGRQAAYY